MTERASGQSAMRSNNWQSMLISHGLVALDSEQKRSGPRVTRLEIGPGRISAGVTGKQLGDCDVVVEWPVWQDDQWAGVVDLLSRQALYTAQLLAGDFPDELELILQQAGLALLPAQQEAVHATCTCDGPPAPPDGQAVCPHIAAVLRDAGAMLADDPWLLFLLRGRVREQVLRTLRRKRRQNGDANGAKNAARSTPQGLSTAFNGLPDNQEPAPDDRPLPQDLHGFWGSARTLEEFRPHVVPPVAELILLRRLGPPAFSHANAEVFDALAAVYRRVTGSALALAYAEDPSPDLTAPDSADPDAANGAPWEDA